MCSLYKPSLVESSLVFLYPSRFMVGWVGEIVLVSTRVRSLDGSRRENFRFDIHLRPACSLKRIQQLVKVKLSSKLVLKKGRTRLFHLSSHVPMKVVSQPRKRPMEALNDREPAACT